MVVKSKEGDWGEYRRLIIAELEGLRTAIENLNSKIDLLTSKDISSIKAEIAVLKFKSGLWGAMAGAIPSAIAVIWVVLKTGAG